jgi:two-component system sensor histidine kinase UhpB
MPPIGDEGELVVFRIAQESLTNAARHAGTTRVDLSLERRAHKMVLRVRDYGRGIDGTRPGSGMRGMRERALLIGAELSIGTAPGGRGTEVVLALPLRERP